MERTVRVWLERQDDVVSRTSWKQNTLTYAGSCDPKISDIIVFAQLIMQTPATAFPIIPSQMR
jgi:hypothetical protein